MAKVAVAEKTSSRQFMNSFVARRLGKIATGLARLLPTSYTKSSPTFRRGSLHPGYFLALKPSSFRES
jgi:hypothetical protein